MSKRIRLSALDVFWQEDGNAFPSTGSPERTEEQCVPYQSWRDGTADWTALSDEYTGHNLGNQRVCTRRPVQTHVISLSARS